MSDTIFCQTFETPCGELILQSVAGKLICCDWSDGWHRATIARRLERAFPHASCLEREDEVIAQTKRQLTEYFAGMRKTFDVPLRLVGTDFQHAVWQELLKLPYGTLTTYGEIACRIGRPEPSGPSEWLWEKIRVPSLCRAIGLSVQIVHSQVTVADLMPSANSFRLKVWSSMTSAKAVQSSRSARALSSHSLRELEDPRNFGIRIGA